MFKFLLLVGLSLVSHLLLAADQTDPIVQATDLELTVPSGETWTYAKTITLTDGAKLVKKGPGTLVLADVSNSFDGGVELQQGVLRVDAEGALGDKKVVLSTTNGRTLVFNAPGATFPNAIEQTAADITPGTAVLSRYSRQRTSRAAFSPRPEISAFVSIPPGPRWRSTVR